MRTPSWIVTALAALAIVVSPQSAPAEEKGAHTPEKGSSDRKSLLDGVRTEYAKQDPAKPAVIFVVPYLKVHGDWAWVQVSPQTKDGKQRFEAQAGLFRRQSGSWQWVTWEPTEEGTDRAAFFQQLKAKHPALPADILPK